MALLLALSQPPALSAGHSDRAKARGSFSRRLSFPAASTFASPPTLLPLPKRGRRCSTTVSAVAAAGSGESEALALPLSASNGTVLQEVESVEQKNFQWNVRYWNGLPMNYMSRDWFPPGFFFGAATSAFQIEGATDETKYGRGPSIWDTFIKNNPDKIADRSNADTAIEYCRYLRYQKDIKLMKDLKLNAYRFSISWPRILPTGRLSGGINQEGVKYYQNLINELKANGIEPFVTLYHWDLPQALEDEYIGFLNPPIVEDFRDYADLCFQLFGDRVKHWITFNEPWVFCKFGYGTGVHAPGRSSHAGVEPYTVAHHLLLAHATAVNLYREKYKESQNGEIGITFNCNWYVPLDKYSYSDDEAVNRVLDFELGWFMDPLTTGEYPLSMRGILGNRLPRFTPQQSELLRKSFDFIGINYYTSSYVSGKPFGKNVLELTNSYDSDSHIWKTATRDGKPIGEPTSTWIYVYPRGVRDLLHYIKKKYEDPIIYITENGFGFKEDQGKQESLGDHGRTDFLKQHLYYVGLAGSEGVRVKGYLLWSLFDNFEWADGYTVRFGIIHIDYVNNYKRTFKHSAEWYSHFLHNQNFWPFLPQHASNAQQPFNLELESKAIEAK